MSSIDREDLKIGLWVKVGRTLLGMSLKEFGLQFGVSSAAVTKWESNEAGLRASTFKQILEFFEANGISSIASGDDSLIIKVNSAGLDAIAQNPKNPQYITSEKAKEYQAQQIDDWKGESALLRSIQENISDYNPQISLELAAQIARSFLHTYDLSTLQLGEIRAWSRVDLLKHPDALVDPFKYIKASEKPQDNDSNKDEISSKD